jgi:alpha-tubulin suppressor-like RCC1 family protein/fibronectin type 3 domain-containing protein
MSRRLLAATTAFTTLAALCTTGRGAAASGAGLSSWGYNALGQLGVSSPSDSTVPLRPAGFPSLTALGAGQNHSLGVASDGSVWAWGDNSQGQLGNGTTTGGATPVQVSNLSGAVAVRGGNAHSLALLSDGTVRAWGSNAEGQLGNGTMVSSDVPVQVANVSGVTAISSGYNHGMALRSDGTVWAWGQGYCGELGNGVNANSDVPVQVSGLSGVVAIAGGYMLSMAVTADGSVWVWGGTCNAIWPDTAVPVQVSGLSNAVAAADRVVLERDGTVWWVAQGANNQPQQVGGLAGVTAIDSSGGTGIAIESDGSVWTWGFNQYGELGDGNTTDSSSAIQVSGVYGATAVAEGGAHALAIASSTAPPSSPQNLSVQTGASGTLSLAWQPPASPGSSDLTAYRVYRGTASGRETFLTQVPATSTTYTDANLAVGTYYYEVTAVNATDEGPRSDQVSASPVVAPTAPQSLAARTGTSAGTVEVTWQPPAGTGSSALTGYRIYRGTASGGETLVTQVPATALAYADSNLPLATYWYQLSAVNTIEGPRSGEASAVPLTPPSAPQDLVAQTVLPTAIQLTWQAPASAGSSAIAGYHVYRGTAPGQEDLLVATLPGSSLTYTDSVSPLKPAYWYRVAAFNTLEGPWSNEACASSVAEALGCGG